LRRSRPRPGRARDLEDCAPSVMNASESDPPRRRDALTRRRFCRRPKDGKAATPRPGPPPDITPPPGARQHPDGVSKVGVLGLYQRPLAGPDSLKQAPCREPRSLSQFQQTATTTHVDTLW